MRAAWHHIGYQENQTADVHPDLDHLTVVAIEALRNCKTARRRAKKTLTIYIGRLGVVILILIAGQWPAGSHTDEGPYLCVRSDANAFVRGFL